MKIQTFEELDIWKLSVEIATDIYEITRSRAFRLDISLTDQIRRAIISVSSNIAEGFERNNNNELIQYLRIAKGSTGEVRSQFFVALKLGYISNDDYQDIMNKLLLLSSKTGKLITYLSTKRKNSEFKTH